MKMMQGAALRACSNRSRTRAAPTPTNISTNSDPEIEKKGTPACPATALASKVLPVPGGPTRSTPLGIRAPSRPYLSLSFRNDTISCSSAFASSTPATSSKVTPVSRSTRMRALDFPTFTNPPKPCFSAKRRKTNIQMPKKSRTGNTQDRRLERNVF